MHPDRSRLEGPLGLPNAGPSAHPPRLMDRGPSNGGFAVWHWLPVRPMARGRRRARLPNAPPALDLQHAGSDRNAGGGHDLRPGVQVDGRFGTAWQIASFWLGLATVASGPIVATRGDRRCQRAAAACCDVAGSRLGDGGIRQAVLPHPRRPSDCMVPATRRLPNGTDWHETDWAARMASATRTGRHRTIPAGLADTNAVMIRRLELQRLPAQEEPRSERISVGRSARCYPARYPTPADRSTPFFGGWMGALHGLRFRPDRPPRWSAQRPLSAGELAGHRT